MLVIYPIAILAIENEEDRLFMQQLYEDHCRLMRAKAREILGEQQYVDDIVSDAILALIDKIPLIRSLECYALRAYVVTTTRNISLNHLRSQKRKSNHSFLDDGSALENIPSDQQEIAADLIRREEIDRIKKGINMLREADRRVLEMKYVLDLPNSEIAAELGIGADSVRPHLQRIRRRAYAVLSEVMDDE